MPTQFTNRFLRPAPATTSPITPAAPATGGFAGLLGKLGGGGTASVSTGTAGGAGSMGAAGGIAAAGAALAPALGSLAAGGAPEQVDGTVDGTDYLAGQRADMAKEQETAANANKAASAVVGAINPAIGAVIAATGAIGSGIRKGNVDKYGFRDMSTAGNFKDGLADSIDPIGNSTRAFSRLGDSDYSIGQKAASFVPFLGSFVTAGTDKEKRDRTLRRMAEANLNRAEKGANSSYAGSGQIFQDGGKVPAAQPVTKPFAVKQEQQYENWVASLPEGHRQSIDPATGNGRDYDYRRAFLDGVQAGENGHFTDKYKLPSHRTFSTESLYFNDKTRDQAGSWQPGANGGNRWVPLNPKAKQPFDEDANGQPIAPARKPAARHAQGGRVRTYGGGGKAVVKPGAPAVAPAGSGTPLHGNPEDAKRYYDNAMSTMQGLIGNKHDEVYTDPASGRECRANSCLSFASTVQEKATGQPVTRTKENLYNPAFTATSEQQGWVPIDMKDARPGDRFQSWQPTGTKTANEFKVADLNGRQLLPGRVPVHMTVFGGWQENGRPSAGNPGMATLYQDGHEFRNADSQVRPVTPAEWQVYRYIGTNGQPTNNPQQAVALNPPAVRRADGGILRAPRPEVAGPARSIIVRGLLHSQRNDIDHADAGTYGMPVIHAAGGRVAEVEKDEYLMNEQLTATIERLREKFSQSKDKKILRQIGALVADDIKTNTTASPRYARRLKQADNA